MNPFSGFLQPQNNRPLEGLATTQDLLRVVQGNKELAQRKLENEQQNTRANSYLALQQGDQAHRFGKEEQKQVEALLAEYQDAEDQGDPVRLSRAAQMLKRFGMDVGQKQMPDLRAFTGEQALPTKPNVQAFTGGQAAAAQTPEEPELSTEEWERQFINNPAPEPERYEQGGKTSDEYRKMLPHAPEEEPVDMGDVDSPEFKQAAAAESAPQAEPQSAQPRRLSTQLLPTVISKGGKQLYESTGPSGRWSPMVQGVFEPFLQHENPQIASAAKRAQSYAAKLIEADDVPPKEAIKLGMDYLTGEANRINAYARTELGSKPRGGGGVPGGVAPKAMGYIKDDMYATLRLPQFSTKGIQDGLLGYDSAINAISSANSASQYDAINQMIQARSGKVVSDRERAIYNNLAGAWNGWMKQFNLLSGGQLPEGYREKLRIMMNEAKTVLLQERDRRAAAAKEFHNRVLQGRGLRPEDIAADSEAVAAAIRRGDAEGAGDPNADLDQ